MANNPNMTIDARKYERTLILVFLKAAKNVLGNVPVRIQNPQNKGIFVDVLWDEELTINQVNTIRGLMEEYIKRDIPIEKVKYDREEMAKLLIEFGYPEKARLMEQAKGAKKISMYQLGDYMNFFYGSMAPSTGYLKVFDLIKYKRGLILRIPDPNDLTRFPEYRDDEKLYDEFLEAERWNDLMGISYLAELNDRIKSGNIRDMILLSEALHEKRIAEIAEMVKESGRKIVLIAGPSSSGKTSFANRLSIQLRVAGLSPLYMGTDDYFVERDETPLGEDGEPDFENLNAIDIELFNRNMNDLMEGKEVDLPRFDFLSGKKIFGERITRLEEGQVLVIEGIHALNEAMTPYIPRDEKFKIYISPLTQINLDIHNRISTTDARMLRRMVRDYQFRGHSAENTIAEWPKVRAGEEKNIFPYNGEADVLFNSVLIYELALLKKYAQPLLEAVPKEAPEYPDAHRLVQFLRFFLPLDGEKYIPNNSIIREFIGGSVLLEK